MTDPIVGVILAGGLARRFGGEKSGAVLAGGSLLSHVIERVRPQVSTLILNTNDSISDDTDLTVVPDGVEGHLGPLAGVLTSMEWAQRHMPEAIWLASFPVDTPFLPTDLVSRLHKAATDENVPLATAQSNGRAHPVVGLWRIDLAADLRRCLVEEGIRRVDRWTARHAVATVTFPTDPVDPFFNVNTPDDLAVAEKLLQKL